MFSINRIIPRRASSFANSPTATARRLCSFVYNTMSSAPHVASDSIPAVMEKSEIPLYSYSGEDFFLKLGEESEDSKFDVAVKKKWDEAEKNNVLRYSVQSQKSKVLEGKFGFLAQLNTERATMRREPESIVSMSQPFDPNRFNFKKILNREILFDIGDGDGNNVIAVNVSPIISRHCLLLPERMAGLPQQVTLFSFRKAVEMMLLSNSEDMRVVFNSLCANASVNHLHWHLYYLHHRMPLECIPLQHFVEYIDTLESFPAKGFCIKKSDFELQSIDEWISYAYKVICCLQKHQIAHNIFITRAKVDAHSKGYDDIRIYIWARASSHGVKNTEDFVIAACELFGHLQIRTEEAYLRLNEDYVSECLEATTAEAFSIACGKIREEFRDEEIKRPVPHR